MFGFGDGWVAAAYVICIASTILCVVYGLLHWNVDDTFPEPVHPADEDLEFEVEV